MKKIITGVAVLAAILFISFVIFNQYIYTEKQETETPLPTESSDKELAGMVTGVDLTGVMLDGPAIVEIETETGESFSIAVPSMGIQLCAASSEIADVYEITVGDQVSVHGTLDEEGRIVPCENASHYLRVVGIYTNQTVGFRFEYPKGPDGYQNETEEIRLSEDLTFQNGIVLVKQESDIIGDPEPSEGLPTIQARVYSNPENQLPAVWIEQHQAETNYNLALSEPVATIVDGTDGLRFTVDGLYAADVYVIASGEYIILLKGEYIDTDSDIYRTFIEIVENFKFIPPVR